MIYYLLLCFITSIAGVGILKTLRIDIPSRVAIFLSPAVTTGLWTIFLGWGILFGHTTKTLALYGWIITGIFFLIGAPIIWKNIRSSAIPQKNGLLWLFALILPIIVMAPYFLHGLFTYGGADAPDGWSYIAVGQTLWDNIRTAEGQLSPLHQYAAHLAHARFISSAMLGFLSPFINHPGDAQAASNLFLAWALFNFASACTFFAITQKTKLLTPIYLILVLYSVWIFKLLAVNNFDNMLSLAFLPIFAGLTQITWRQERELAILFALFAASVFYTYIELAPFILGGATLFVGQYLLTQRNKSLSQKLLFIFLVSVLTLILISPYLQEGIQFLLGQIRGAYAAHGRPGEGYFPELTSCRHRLTLILGGEPNHTHNKIIGLVFLCFLVSGWIALWRKKQFSFVICSILLIAAAADMIFFQHYSYGAYKLFLISWWLTAFCVMTTFQLILTAKRFKWIMVASISLLAAIYFYHCYHTQRFFASIVSIQNIEPYRALAQLGSTIGDQAIIVKVDDGIASEWAVYYLRDIPIQLAQYRIYMINAHYYMDRAKTVPAEKLRFLLTDDPKSFASNQLIWSSGPYYLWKLPLKKAKISKTSSPHT